MVLPSSTAVFSGRVVRQCDSHSSPSLEIAFRTAEVFGVPLTEVFSRSDETSD
jgi:hypothetical protein